jgi:hypothetical protein
MRKAANNSPYASALLKDGGVKVFVSRSKTYATNVDTTFNHATHTSVAFKIMCTVA